MACCLFVWLVVVGIIIFGTLGIWSIVNIGWVGYYYKSLDHANGVRDRARFQFCYCRREDPARGVDDGHKFFQQKKTQFFWKKKLGWSMGKEITTTFRHVGTWGSGPSRVELRWGRESQLGTHIMDSLRF
jgi:hypothetical protein